MVARVQELSIDEFSKAFIQFQRLPRACKIVVKVLKTARQKRSDTLVRMYPLRAPRVLRVDDNSNVKELLDAAKTALSTDVKTRGWSLELHDANGWVVDGHTGIKKLKREDGNRQAELRYDEEAEMLLGAAEDQVAEAHDSAEAPEITVPRAYLRALIAQYDVKVVRAALRDL